MASFSSNFDCTFEHVGQISSLSYLVASKTNTFVRKRSNDARLSVKIISTFNFSYRFFGCDFKSRNSVVIFSHVSYYILSFGEPSQRLKPCQVDINSPETLNLLLEFLLSHCLSILGGMHTWP